MGTLLRGRMYGPLLLVMLAACSNGSGSLEDQQPPPPSQGAQSGLTMGGSVSGLTGSGLVLQNNGAGDLAVAADGSFTFATTLSSGAAYNVTVLTQPTTPTQTCTVANGAGSVANSNVTDIVVTCTNAPRYTIGGAVSGLTGGGLVLQNNAGDNLSIIANGNFTFASALTNGSTYNVVVGAQPNGQNCIVRNATGTIAAANVANVEVACMANQFTVGIEVSGLAGKGLVLQLNGANDLPIVGNGKFTFPAALPPNSAYAVTIKGGVQPNTPTQTCTLANASGTIASANVTNVTMTCVTSSFSVGGEVRQLAGSGLVLQLNDGQDLPIAAAAGSFTFPPLLSGTQYTVKVKEGAQPTGPTQNCTIAHDKGVVGAAPVSNIVVTCATRTFAVRGTVIGLITPPLVLQNNGGNNLTITANGSFEFTAPVASGGSYSVTVLAAQSNPTQACTITNGSGPVTTANIENVVVSCSAAQFSVGGTINNLVGSQLELSNNDTDRVTISSGSSFQFPRTVTSGATYNVQVVRQPANPKQTCAVDGASGTGTVVGSNISSVVVSCVTDGFRIGGQIAGLRGSGLILRLDGVEDLPITANGSFQFLTRLIQGTLYSVSIVAQPSVPDPLHLCYVAAGAAGAVGDMDVGNVQINCL